MLKGSDTSPLLRPTEYCVRGFGSDIAGEVEELVPVSTIDRYFGECSVGIEQPRVFYKTDTQAYDLKVTRGAENILPVIAGITNALCVESAPYLEAIQVMTDQDLT